MYNECCNEVGLFPGAMTMADLVVKIPQEIVNAAQIDEQYAKTLLAVELYRDRKVTLGMARRLANLDISEFLLELGKHGVTIDYTVEDVDQDTIAINKFSRQPVR